MAIRSCDLPYLGEPGSYTDADLISLVGEYIKWARAVVKALQLELAEAKNANTAKDEEIESLRGKLAEETKKADELRAAFKV